MAGSSLVPFHRVLIATAIVFCAGFSWWMFSLGGDGGPLGYRVIGIVFAVFAAGLVVYLWNLGRVLGYDDRDRG